MKPFYNQERFPRQYFNYKKKFIIGFEIVVDVVATKHTSCRIILMGTENFTLIKTSVKNSVFAYLFKKKACQRSPFGAKM